MYKHYVMFKIPESCIACIKTSEYTKTRTHKHGIQTGEHFGTEEPKNPKCPPIWMPPRWHWHGPRFPPKKNVRFASLLLIGQGKCMSIWRLPPSISWGPSTQRGRRRRLPNGRAFSWARQQARRKKYAHLETEGRANASGAASKWVDIFWFFGSSVPKCSPIWMPRLRVFVRFSCCF